MADVPQTVSMTFQAFTCHQEVVVVCHYLGNTLMQFGDFPRTKVKSYVYMNELGHVTCGQ